MKITITGPAAVLRVSDDTEILIPKVLRRFHRLKSDESCVDYLDTPLNEIGLVGGQLELVFDKPSQRLRVRTVYHAPRELKKKELKLLVEATQGQWSDGIGEALESGDEDLLLDASPLCADPKDLQVEQIDDGTKVARPKKSPLFAAVQKNDTAAIANHLDAGENIDPRDRDGNTPLMLTMWGDECQTQAAMLLIQRGAKLEVANKIGYTPLMMAASRGQIDILNEMLKSGANPNYAHPDLECHPLHYACLNQQMESVKRLIEAGADVNLACDSGYTALMHLKPGDVEIARFLVEHGADIEAKNIEGKGMDKTLKKAVSKFRDRS
ncbi:MAG: ankyrin repeat domain-containing protein [Planctomycetes bacterium]|nr:ankyrin repeat domain-containing protein [Planctomycetota bacterium]